LYYSCDLEAQKNRWKQKKSLSSVLSEIIAGAEICPKCGMRQGNILLNDAQLKKNGVLGLDQSSNPKLPDQVDALTDRSQ
jgi:hypothetical protein